MTFDDVSPHARSLLADNPGPMTLTGTNSYVLAAPGATERSSVVVVDPGPDLPDHLAALAAAGKVELILLTHHHDDHSGGSRRFAALTGAPVRAVDPQLCVSAAPLQDGEVIYSAGVTIRVLATPGHTADSVCFVLPEDGERGSVLTGDTILGKGTTVIFHPDGQLGPYLASLERLAALGRAMVLPGHGPVLPAVDEIAEAYLVHRRERLAEVRAAVERLGPEASVETVTAVIYDDVAPNVRFAAERSVAATLEFLGPAGSDGMA